MKLNVEINNLSSCRVREDFFVRIIKETLKLSEYDFLRDKKVSLSLALVKPEEIRKLNKKYRQKNAVTDVLSFAEYKSRASLAKIKEKEVFLGELILCYNDIKEYSQNNKQDVKQELATVVSHGLLHLLGFSHSPKMFRLQEGAAQFAVRRELKKVNLK